ncbi:predicted protein [Naegleria gruberi]|uniref:Predicted protein n=1 Tax=Naegleria gruberi TaxID=5762 RepID=D2V974_NAEGR|nr:uncharacterized protein NAEGRDRAFT_65589 [Naegleria gruberi]EFC46661.1 predicted protein [Naegleria gruberi]|eukprot:XP_002679405.1 predicted protein [Naegleria gruberi strain NEG-M]
MNDFSTKLVMEMMKQLLQQNSMDEICGPITSLPVIQPPPQQFLLPNQLSFPQPSNNISNNYCIQTSSMLSHQTCTSSSSNISTNTDQNYSKPYSSHSTTLISPPTTNNFSTPIFSNSNFEQILNCIESNRLKSTLKYISNSEDALNNQLMIAQLVDLIDQIIYLNSLNSNLKHETKPENHESNIPVKEEFCNTVHMAVKEGHHSDSSHSSLLSNKISDSNNESTKKRKRIDEAPTTTEQSATIQQSNHEEIHQKRKISKQTLSENHSDIHSNSLITPLKTNNNNNKELLLNQFCNYTVDTLKKKLTNTEKRGRGRPRKQPDETLQSQNQSSTNSFYMKSAFHHVHFNKQ